MALFWIMFIVALVFSSVGFKKTLWFTSIGYGLSVAAIGVALLIGGRATMTTGIMCTCILFVLYGLRLAGYLAFRERCSRSYNAKMKGEPGFGANASMVAKFSVWISAALLYTAETSPATFRIANGSGDDVMLVLGILISAAGLAIESIADLQKNAAKKKNPAAFVSTGLYSIVRCPNYFGEMLFWTGAFLGGIPIYQNIWQWLAALMGYLGIVYVMFAGARRLEIRQNKAYGKDLAYKKYVHTTPIIIPLVPLYSVEKFKWLMG